MKIPYTSSSRFRACALGVTVCFLFGCTQPMQRSAAVPTDLTELSATDAATLIRTGKMRSEDLVRALIAKAKARSDLNAFITLDEQGALKAAQAADATVKAGTAKGALHGVPLAIKDNIHVAGLPNTAGAPPLKKFIPATNAPVAQKLIDAGAIVLGKTNMHELAFGITSNNGGFGAVGNPYDPTRFPGGSSGGSGAAIAARMAPAGLGSDTGGSVRVPAGLNGLAGLRPTLLRYSQEGVTPISHTRDTVGPMARTVADLVLLDGAITGTATTLAPRSLKGLRLGVPTSYYWENLDPETRRVCEAALAKLQAAGVELVKADIANIGDLDAKVSFPVALYEVMTDLPAYLKKYNAGIDMTQLQAGLASPDVKGLIGAMLEGKPPTIPEAVYKDALAARPVLQKVFADYFAANNVTGIIFPTTAAPAQVIATSGETFDLNGQKAPTFPTFIRNADPGSNAGIPGITVNAGMSASGLPIGIAVDGPANSDRELLAIALAMEQVLGRAPPPR